MTHQAPIQALKKWQSEKPELFVKRVYIQAGLDTSPVVTVVVGAGLPVNDCDLLQIGAGFKSTSGVWRLRSLGVGPQQPVQSYPRGFRERFTPRQLGLSG